MKKLLAVLLFAAIILPAQAAEDAPVVKTKVKTVAAFKNGLAFVFRSGSTSLKDGWTVLEELPQASLGTLWIGTMPPNRVSEVVSYKGTIEKEIDAANLSDLLRANIGKRVTITYSSGYNAPPQTVSGTLTYVPDPNKMPDMLSSTVRYDPGRVDLVMMKPDTGGLLAFSRNLVQTLLLENDYAIRNKTTLPKLVTSAKVRVSGVSEKGGISTIPAQAEITMAYLEKGVTWSPSYLVNIKDEKKADITMEAVIANDVEDLEDADVSFVVGYPNFAFANIITPMDAQRSVSDFVQALTSGQSESQARYRSAMTQSVTYNTAVYDSVEAWRPESAYTAGQPMGGEGNEDLYFYHQPNVTLKKGDRARYTVFTSQVPYEHVYEWDIPDSMNINEQGRNEGNNRKIEDYEQVWHVLKLENTSKQPWTTAPALAVNGSMPVAQDTLKYTPPGVKNSLKLTLATDVRVEQAQTEVSRKQTRVWRDDFDEVTVEGKLSINNLKSKPVKMDVTKTLVGEALSQSDGGKVTRQAKKLTAVNPESEIKWDLQLRPGDRKVLTYTYKVLLYR